MRRTFAATVVGLGETDTSGYTAGAHTISLAIDGAAPLGPAPRKVELPIFTREEARELGALYRTENAVRVIVETGNPEDATQVDICPDPKEGHCPHNFRPWGICGVCGPMLSAGYEIARRYAPPLSALDGRPTCCGRVNSHGAILVARKHWAVRIADGLTAIQYCPFCGARLPEVPT